MERKAPMRGTAVHYAAEMGTIPINEPRFPGRGNCQCGSPRIYVGGKVLEICQRCGKRYARKR